MSLCYDKICRNLLFLNQINYFRALILENHMSKIRVSAVRYTNSIPFIYGLQNYSLEDEMSLSLDTPADCYHNLLSGNADIGLVPVVLKSQIPSLRQVSDFGIGANGNVLSVIMVAQVPIAQVKTIFLDYQSKSSVMLIRLLCRDFWNIAPEFREALPGFEQKAYNATEARLIIGDRAFHFHKQKDIFVTDLAGEWTKYTGLPFVFAFWASLKVLPEGFEEKFNGALNFGMTHKVRLAKELAGNPEFASINLPVYLNENIIHEISPPMREGMNLFLHLIRDFQ